MNDFVQEKSSGVTAYDKNINGIFGMQGWICPKCGRVYSPFTQMCLYCGKQEINTTTTNIQTNIINGNNEK